MQRPIAYHEARTAPAAASPVGDARLDSRSRRTVLRAIVVLACATLLAAGLSTVDAKAHSSEDWVYVYNPIGDGDGDHRNTTAWWPWGREVAPAGHHIVYSNWGYRNDWSIDVFSRASGRTFVTPFGSRTNTGHAVQSKVVGLRPGCASGNPADGGYRVTIEARDTATGVVLGRADLMHVASPRVGNGQVLGSWTVIGYTSRFRWNGCYQVSTDNGIHGHLEFINQHRYACWIPYGYSQGLSELTRIGIVGKHYGGQRAAC